MGFGLFGEGAFVGEVKGLGGWKDGGVVVDWEIVAVLVLVREVSKVSLYLRMGYMPYCFMSLLVKSFLDFFDLNRWFGNRILGDGWSHDCKASCSFQLRRDRPL